MVPNQAIANGANNWRTSLHKILDAKLKGSDVFNDKSIEIKDRKLLHVFDQYVGGQRQACAVLSCRISVVNTSQTIAFFQIDQVYSTSDTIVEVLNQKDLLDTLDWYRIWRDQPQQESGGAKSKSLTSKISQISRRKSQDDS